MKYLRAKTSFATVKSEITVAIEVTNCPHRCKHCHSPELCQDIGIELDECSICTLMKHFTGFYNEPLFTCVAFMGGDHEPKTLLRLLKWVKGAFPAVKTCLYTGSENVSDDIKDCLDYLKTGRYDEALGGLDSPTTNQRFYQFERNSLHEQDN